MIVFAAITPHSPLFLPTIGKNEAQKFSATTRAFGELWKHFTPAAADTMLIISAHGTHEPDAVALNISGTYTGDLSAFGDLKTKPQFQPDFALADQLQRGLRAQGKPITLLSSPLLDYGATVPLVLLEVPGKTRLVPLAPSQLDFKTHFGIGEAIKEVCAESHRRIAVVCSVNLSHRLTSDAPAGFSKEAVGFDALVRESLETKNTARLLRLDPALVTEAGPCGFRGICMFLGMLSGTHYTSHTLAYEYPFGVGYLTTHFLLS